jgi:hypothetical protein
MGYNWIFNQVNWVTPGFSFSYFFFNPARFQPRIPGRPVEPDRISKLWLE